VSKQKGILVYTTPEKLLHKQGKLPDDDDYSESGEYYWSLTNLPKNLEEIQRFYVATKGFVRGYFQIESFGEQEESSVEFNCKTWHDVTPTPQKPFQGFKYIEVQDVHK